MGSVKCEDEDSESIVETHMYDYIGQEVDAREKKYKMVHLDT